MIVDASVAIKWIYQEKSGVETARSLLRSPAALATSSVWLLEVGNVIQRRCAKGLVSAGEARSAYAFLTALPIEVLSDADDAATAFDLAIRFGHATYDCSYLALALRRNQLLVTADLEFSDRATKHGYGASLKLIGPDQP